MRKSQNSLYRMGYAKRNLALYSVLLMATALLFSSCDDGGGGITYTYYPVQAALIGTDNKLALIPAVDKLCVETTDFSDSDYNSVKYTVKYETIKKAIQSYGYELSENKLYSLETDDGEIFSIDPDSLITDGSTIPIIGNISERFSSLQVFMIFAKVNESVGETATQHGIYFYDKNGTRDLPDYNGLTDIRLPKKYSKDALLLLKDYLTEYCRVEAGISKVVNTDTQAELSEGDDLTADNITIYYDKTLPELNRFWILGGIEKDGNSATATLGSWNSADALSYNEVKNAFLKQMKDSGLESINTMTLVTYPENEGTPTSTLIKETDTIKMYSVIILDGDYSPRY